MKKERTKASRCLPWVLAAGCLILLSFAAFMLLPASDPTPSPTTTYVFTGERYVYRITEGEFSDYVGGKVIEDHQLGEKLGQFTVEAGWERNGEKLSSEKLKAEVYAIGGISSETAAALKFLDKGEAVTTTHYYVILNPSADLSAVSDYVIPSWMPNNTGDE